MHPGHDVTLLAVYTHDDVIMANTHGEVSLSSVYVYADQLNIQTTSHINAVGRHFIVEVVWLEEHATAINRLNLVDVHALLQHTYTLDASDARLAIQALRHHQRQITVRDKLHYVRYIIREV